MLKQKIQGKLNLIRIPRLNINFPDMRYKNFILILIILFCFIWINSCTPTHHHQVKKEGDVYKFEIFIQSPRFKGIPEIKVQLNSVTHNTGTELRLLKTDRSGKIRVELESGMFNKQLEIVVPDQEFKNSQNFILPYSYKVKDELKKRFTWDVVIPYNNEFLETRDEFTRTLYIRRVLLNKFPEWDEDVKDKIKTGNIEEGMTTDMIRAALGNPQNITRYYTNGENQTWTYFLTPSKKVIVFFEDGLVKKIKREYIPSNVPPPVYNN